ncbi:hypothetical protein NEOLEDRAFT_1140183 [Neolentinus lepideus HHB14362 ss-1]|uniref:Uncharacterized protein n=1 Tax=Neolentinus lepideus HHB14362 ss-1 TaxID=1314782 RepID=A0A165PD27_9AGAM|nr:hypothetical protein NEOLEDRAFT_1140183 [Neolentinus lepideus HHB14362 ss-1]
MLRPSANNQRVRSDPMFLPQNLFQMGINYRSGNIVLDDRHPSIAISGTPSSYEMGAKGVRAGDRPRDAPELRTYGGSLTAGDTVLLFDVFVRTTGEGKHVIPRQSGDSTYQASTDTPTLTWPRYR